MKYKKIISAVMAAALIGTNGIFAADVKASDKAENTGIYTEMFDDKNTPSHLTQTADLWGRDMSTQWQAPHSQPGKGRLNYRCLIEIQTMNL